MKGAQSVEQVRPIINRARLALTAAANAPGVGLYAAEFVRLRSDCAEVILEVRLGEQDRARTRATALIERLEQTAAELEGAAAGHLRAAIDALGEVLG